MKLYEKYKTLFIKFGLNTPLRIAHFMSQIEHESNLKPIQENLNYSAQGLLKTFPKYFNSETANLYERRPIQIANKVYANRMGNGNENSGDGHKYKGRGFIQLTGKNNYKALSDATGIDYLNNPDLLLNEADAMNSALWFWNENNLNRFVTPFVTNDKGIKDFDYSIKNISRAINGGYNGIDHRKELFNKYKKELGL